jgi:hypothetical protein
MEKQYIIPDPEKKLAVIKRFLHIIALLQNPRDPRPWNGTTLADILSLDEDHAVLSDKNIRDYINKYLVEELKIDVDKARGQHWVELASPIEPDKLESLINIYCLFVARDTSREQVLAQLMKRCPDECLWMLATIYFAARRRRRIECDYTNNQGEEKRYLLDPYELVLRNNNLYLYCAVPGDERGRLFIVNRIRNLAETDQDSGEPALSVDEAFSGSLGSFIGEKRRVTIRYSRAIAVPIEQALGALDVEERPCARDGWIESSFFVSDDKFLCKQLFMYGREVEIVGPRELRELMVTMIRESMSVY